jgi:Holliday junction resolvase RusA-like endonuclease
MKQLSFFARGIPKGQPRVRAFVRGRHAGVYDPGTADDFKACIHLATLKAITSEIARPIFTGPIRCSLEFVFPRPKSHYTSKGFIKPTAPILHTQKPDRDNLDKAVLDTLTKLQIWEDDCQVCAGQISKRFAVEHEPSGVHIHIDEII